MAESSSAPVNADKTVIVRVKRKAYQSCLDAFWLEINERPVKRPLLDFGKLSLSEASTSGVEGPTRTKVLVHHLETVTTTKETSVVLQSLVPNSAEALKSKENNEGRRSVRTSNKQDELLLKSRKQQVASSRSARFEQIWRSRKENKSASEVESIYETCRIYDVVRVDAEEEKVKMQEQKTKYLEDLKMMSEYLPLLQKVLPSAAKEIEEDIQSSTDGYVYDYYAINKDASLAEADSQIQYPLVQVDDVDDDDFYDGPDNDSDYDSNDSNAEDHHLNDYPDEETSEDDEDEDEVRISSSEKESESESRIYDLESEDDHHLHEGSGPLRVSDDENQFFEYAVYSDGEGYEDTYDYDSNEEER